MIINQSARLCAIVMALALLAPLSYAQGEPRHKELPNYHRVSDKLYRGGQPRARGLKKLSELGIKTIINLRGEDRNTRAEQKEAESLGLRYYSVPMPGFTRPPNDQIDRVMEIIDAPENGPVFIHCRRGSDRTGTVAAIYRIKHEGWTAERARAEARRYGMSWVEFGMKDYISDYHSRQNTGSEPQGIKEEIENLPDLIMSYGGHGMRLLKRARYALNF